MGGMGGSTPWDSARFRECFVVDLVQPFRCEDPAYWELLQSIRTTRPTATNVRGCTSVADIMRRRRAWHGHCPTVVDLRRLMDSHPTATFLAISRAGTRELNDLAVKAIYGDAEPLTWILGTWRAIQTTGRAAK